MDGSQLTSKVAYGCQSVIQGEGRFTQQGLQQVILPVNEYCCGIWPHFLLHYQTSCLSENESPWGDKLYLRRQWGS